MKVGLGGCISVLKLDTAKFGKMHLKCPMYNARFMLFSVELSAVTRKKIMLRYAYLLCKTKVFFLFIRWLRIYCPCETFIETHTLFQQVVALFPNILKNDIFRVYKFPIIFSLFVLFFLFFFISLFLYPFPLSQKLLTSLSPSLRPICL